MEAITAFLESFDISKLLPELGKLVSDLRFWAGLFMLVGPLTMLILGLWYFLLPTKEANHYIGFRTYFGMGSVEAWQFTQRVAGAVWSVLGLALSLIMLLVSLGFGASEGLDMANAAFACVVWELVLIGGACIGIDVVVALRYDRKGEVRPDTKIPEDFLKIGKKK